MDSPKLGRAVTNSILEEEQDARRLDAQLLSDLWIFRAVARHESITAAAIRLGVTQGAVSQRILRLEGRLGAPLFVRYKSRISLTEAGTSMFEAMSQVASILNESVGRITRSRRKAIVVSCVPSVATEWLVPHLEDFYRLHPGIEVFVRSEMASSTANRMEDDGIDVLVDYDPSGATGLQELASLQEFEFPVCSRHYREQLDAGGIADAEIVLLHDDAPWMGAPKDYEWQTWRQATKLEWPGCQTASRHFNLAHLAYHAAMCDQGVALGRSVTVNRLMSKGELVAALDIAPVEGATYHFLTTRPGDLKSPVRQFAKWCSEAMAETQRQTLMLFDPEVN